MSGFSVFYQSSRPYCCIVVDTESGFVVTIPAEVEAEEVVENEGMPLKLPAGKYLNHNYLLVDGGEGVPTVKQFREDGGALVDSIIAASTGPVTLLELEKGLAEAGYSVIANLINLGIFI